MKVIIHVAEGESSKDAKKLRDELSEAVKSYRPAHNVIFDFRFASEYGEAGHPPWR